MLFFSCHSMVFARLPWPWSEIARKILPAPGTNQNAGFGGYRPLAHWEKSKSTFFSEASQRSGILNPWIWLANNARSSGLDFPIRSPRTDRSNPRENLKWNHFTPAQRNVGFFFLKWNFSLTIRCKVKEKISNGIRGLVILRKRRVFLCFLFELWFSLVINTPFDLTQVSWS